MEKNEEKKKYDLTTLLTEEDENIVKNLIEKYGGEEVVDIRPFTKINLAYPIKENSMAFMSAVGFLMTPSSLVSLKKELGDNDSVLRYMVLRDGSGSREKKKEKEEETQDKGQAKQEKRSPKKQEKFVSNKDLEEKIKEFE